MHERKANSTPLYDWAQQFGDAHARPCRRSHIDLVQRKKTVTPINHSNMELLLLAPSEERRCERRQI
jgi:hypothetical protein